MPYVEKQYDSTLDFVGDATYPNVTDTSDKDRIKAYKLYDNMYHNRPTTFSVTLRGDSDIEIYLPSLKKYVNAVARFLCVGMDFVVDPDGLLQTANPDTQTAPGNPRTAEITFALKQLFVREKMYQKILQQKKALLTKGDCVWHITADDSKAKANQISIHTVDPAMYFPEEDDDGSIIAVMLVDEIAHPVEKDKTVARVQKYTKEYNEVNGKKVFTGIITTETKTYEVGAWDYRNLEPDKIKPISTIVDTVALPSEIKAIPVYHMAATPPSNSSWGLSIAAGIEYILNALNQSATYEDLTLILNGLGIYVSTAGPPTDNTTGQPTT